MRKRAFLVGIVLLVAIVATWYFVSRKKTSVDAMHDMSNAIVQGRQSTAVVLYDGASRLTEAQANGLLLDVVRPYFSDLSHVSTEVLRRENETSTLTMNFEDREGKKVQLLWSAQDTRDGGAFQLYTLLLRVWAVPYQTDGWRALTSREKYESIIQGIARDRDKLESLGLQGCYAARGFTKWSNLDAQMRGLLEKLDDSS